MKTIPFSPPDITEAEIDEVVDALKSGWITTGPKTKELERAVVERCQTEKAVCLNSNTACSEMTLRVLGIGPGDEVIVPAYTYTATVSPVLHVGATPIMVDCEEGKYTMDLKKLEESITDKTKVIIPVDLFGIPAQYDEIKEIIERNKNKFIPNDNEIQKKIARIVLVADAAHSYGAKYHGKPAAIEPDFANFSFHAVKNLTTAEGGAVTWKHIPGIDDDDLYHQYQLLSLHGQSKDALSKTKGGSWEYDIEGPWYKCNMTDVHAAIGLAQNRRYDEILQRRKDIISKYNENLEDLNIQVLDPYNEEHESSGHLYVIRLFHEDGKPFSEKERNIFIEKLAEKGVSSNVHYKPLPMMSGYKKMGFDIKNYPNSYKQYSNTVTLPLYTKLTDEDVNYINQTVKTVYKAMA